MLGWFESIALCFTLLALWAILSDRPILAGVAIGAGILVKPYVALIGAVALLVYLSTINLAKDSQPAQGSRRSIIQLVKLITAGAVTLGLGLLPFLIAAPQMVLAHLDTLMTLPGWSSPYALIDGVIKHVDPKVADRFDVALAVSPLVPSRIPWGVVTLAFGVIYLVILWRVIRRTSLRAQSPSGKGAAKQSPPNNEIASSASGLLAMTDARTAIGLAALTFIFYLLWSKGFSPQWVLYLIAFLCILLPTFLGTILIAVLEVMYVIEWPITFILLNADPVYLTAVVFVRTAYIVGLALFFGAVIFTDEPSPRWETVKRWTRLGSAVAVVAMLVLTLGALPLYAAQRYQADAMRQAVEVIKDQSTPDRANVIFDRVDTAERLAPFLPGWSSVAALQLGGKADAWSAQKIQAFSSEQPEAWYILDFGAEQKADQRQAIDRKLSETLCKVSREFAGSAQVSHFVNAQPDRDLDTTAEFENGLRLDRARISSTDLTPGDPLCLELHWSTNAPLPTDYTIFVHVLDQNRQIVAQSDLQPGGGYAPTSGWPIGQPITDRHGVVLPPMLSAGEYQIVIGLYGPDGVRLTSSTGKDVIALSEITIQ